MSDNIYGTTPDKLFLNSLLMVLRQCVDPQYRNYYNPYPTDPLGKPIDRRYFGHQVGPDYIIILAHKVEELAQEIETADPSGLPNDYIEICQLYNRWYLVMRQNMPHKYDFIFPVRRYPEQPEFDFLTNNGTGRPPATPYPAATTADDEATRRRLHLDSRYATGADRNEILDRLGKGN